MTFKAERKRARNMRSSKVAMMMSVYNDSAQGEKENKEKRQKRGDQMSMSAGGEEEKSTKSTDDVGKRR